MEEFKRMELDERYRQLFIPLGPSIYDGRGFLLGTRRWTTNMKKEFGIWAADHDVKTDNDVVYIFPDLETLTLAKMVFG